MPQTFNDKHLEKLLSQKRLEMLRVDDVLKISKINSGKKVLDIGAGPGVFTIPVAKVISGNLTAVDMSPKMTDYLSNCVAQEALTNVKIITGTLDLVKEDNFDRVLIIHLIHEVAEAADFAKEVAKRTAKDGLVTIVDWKKIQSEMGPSYEHRLSENDVMALFESDFEQVERLEWGSKFYLMVLRKIS